MTLFSCRGGGGGGEKGLFALVYIMSAKSEVPNGRGSRAPGSSSGFDGGFDDLSCYLSLIQNGMITKQS